MRHLTGHLQPAEGQGQRCCQCKVRPRQNSGDTPTKLPSAARCRPAKEVTAGQHDEPRGALNDPEAGGRQVGWTTVEIAEPRPRTRFDQCSEPSGTGRPRTLTRTKISSCPAERFRGDAVPERVHHTQGSRRPCSVATTPAPDPAPTAAAVPRLRCHRHQALTITAPARPATARHGSSTANGFEQRRQHHAVVASRQANCCWWRFQQVAAW